MKARRQMIGRSALPGARRSVAAFISICATALVIAGCGGTDDGGTTTDATASQAPATTDTTQPAQATGGGGAPPAGGGSAGATAQSAKVDISNFDYAPKAIKVKAGGTVTWTNSDPANHTATQSPGGSGFDTGTLGKGDSETVTFKEPGTFQYVCVFHAFMTGTVEVVE